VRGRKSADFRVDTSHKLFVLFLILSFYKSQIKRFGVDCKYTQTLDFTDQNPYYL